MSNGSTGLLDCGNWAESVSWAVPTTSVSGIYFARLRRPDTGGASHVFFVVRDDAAASDVLFQTSDTTWQAYNQYGGNSFYVGSPAGRAYKLSYNRPFTTRGTSPEDWIFNAEYPMVRWIEANGYDVSYTTGVDTDRTGANELPLHRLFLSVGHDEYWSGRQRANVEAARASGVNLAFFSGNEVFWKTRWESSIDGSNTPYRTLVTYKETHANAKIDPQDPPTWTGTWRDKRFSPPADGGPLVAFVSADDTAAGNKVNSISGGSLTWELVLRTNARRGTAEIWRAFAVNALSNVTVTATLAQSVASSITVVSFKGADTTGVNGAGAIGAVKSASGVGAPTATLATTRAGAWVFGVGTDWDNPIARTLGPNQTLVHQYMPPVGDTYWVQRMTTTTAVSGTNVTINDVSPIGDQYNLSICEIRPAS